MKRGVLNLPTQSTVQSILTTIQNKPKPTYIVLNITQFIVDSGIWQCRVGSPLFPSILSLSFCKQSQFSILLSLSLSVSSATCLSFYLIFISLRSVTYLSFYPLLSVCKDHFSILLSFSLSVSSVTSLSFYPSLSL
jgi:hypothetical protein